MAQKVHTKNTSTGRSAILVAMQQYHTRQSHTWVELGQQRSLLWITFVYACAPA